MLIGFTPEGCTTSSSSGSTSVLHPDAARLRGRVQDPAVRGAAEPRRRRLGQAARRVPAWIILGTFVFAAAATPSTDPFSMLMLALPMTLLFFVSEVIARWYDRRRRASASPRTCRRRRGLGPRRRCPPPVTDEDGDAPARWSRRSTPSTSRTGSGRRAVTWTAVRSIRVGAPRRRRAVGAAATALPCDVLAFDLAYPAPVPTSGGARRPPGLAPARSCSSSTTAGSPWSCPGTRLTAERALEALAPARQGGRRARRPLHASALAALTPAPRRLGWRCPGRSRC